MATTASVSFQGIATGVKTDDLVNAIIAQESSSVNKIASRQSFNAQKSSTLTAFKTAIGNLSVSLAALQDKPTDSAAMQDVVTKFNAAYTIVKNASVATKGSDGSIISGSLSNDLSYRQLMTSIRTAITGSNSGESGDYTNLSSVGVKTMADGSLSLSSATFQAAALANPTAVKAITSMTDARSLVSSLTEPTSRIETTLSTIRNQNATLAAQLNSGLAALARRKTVLSNQFSKMETIIAQLKAAGTALSSTSLV